MANQIAKTKQQISLTLPRDMIKRLDALAVERGTSRAALITDAVAALLDGQPEPADTQTAIAEAKLDSIAAKLDALSQAQLAQSTVIVDAIKAQPIAVQQALPPAEREPTAAEVRAYLEHAYPNRFEFDMFDSIVEPRPKGLLARLRGI